MRRAVDAATPRDELLRYADTTYQPIADITTPTARRFGHY